MMDQFEQGMADLVALIDRYGKEIRAISEETLEAGRESSTEEFQGKVAGVQDRIYREALEMYGHLVAAAAEVERELLAKLTDLKGTMGRAALLKEVITSTVKPAAGQKGKKG